MLDKLCIYQKLPYDQSWLAPWLRFKLVRRNYILSYLASAPGPSPMWSPQLVLIICDIQEGPVRNSSLWSPVLVRKSLFIPAQNSSRMAASELRWHFKNLYTVPRWWEGTRNPSLHSASIHWYSKEIRKGMVFPGCLPSHPKLFQRTESAPVWATTSARTGVSSSQPAPSSAVITITQEGWSVCLCGGVLPLWDFHRFPFDFLVLTSADTRMLPVELSWTRLLNCVSAHVSLCVCLYIDIQPSTIPGPPFHILSRNI